MTFGSLFTGVAGFDAAIEECGMECLWQVERDRDCNRVLQRHYPDVRRIMDVTAFRAMLEPKNARRIRSAAIVRPDLICGGFPCQDLSVAGRRAGLAGSRSGLWFIFRRIVAIVRPRWVLIENVPGLLSSNGGRDMGTILGALGRLGYGWAYRSFDAQYFGLAQRRERVFIVGCFGDGRRAAQVLFESDRLPWHPAPSRKAGARIAYAVSAGSGGSKFGSGRQGQAFVQQAFTELGEGHVTYQECDVSGTVRGTGGGGIHSNLVAGPLQAHTPEHGHAMTTQQAAESGHLIAHTLRSEGADASEDGTGRGTPLAVVPILEVNGGTSSRGDGPNGCGIGEPGDPMFTLQARHQHAIAFDTTQITSPGNYSQPKPGEPCHPLASGMHAPAVAFTQRTRQGHANLEAQEDLAYALDAPKDGGRKKGGIVQGMAVRRLTPRECERLQGFPDDWTRWDADGKEISDSARYRMLGNAVAKPCAGWIGRRILEAHA